MFLRHSFLALLVMLFAMDGQAVFALDTERTHSASPVVTKTFHGHTCTDDCSGHKAGYAWAQKKGLTSEDECGGRSNSFIEGCRVYVQELREAVQP